MPDLMKKVALSRSWQVFKTGVWNENPIFRQILGICSTLAVTNLMINTLVMCAGLIFVLTCSNVTVSLLRAYTPRRIRMIVQTLIIAAYVIIVKILLDAYLPNISAALGAYVGLIITNCIIMGRAEAFASSNSPWPSFVDGIACGLGYSFILIAIAFFRELMGQGTLFGVQLLGEWWRPWTIMVMPPGAFFALALVIWVARRHAAPPAAEQQSGGPQT
ncbi:MAG: NADH:ubiquinone reductase (Na(+)-transporting) subunit D [Candidatus Brocadiia bacterium]|jgi:Na+-transporting NADH:ubiquinone oxidoreductase subunit D